MLSNMSLRFKLIGSFCIVAIVLCVVGWVGFAGVASGKKSIDGLAQNEVPCLVTLSNLQQGQMGVRLLCNAVLNPEYPEDRKQVYPSAMDGYWKTIDESITKFEALPRVEKEEQQWQETPQTAGHIQTDVPPF